MSNKHANHTKYSDYVILSEMEKFRTGEYRFKNQAFQVAADKLNMRLTQIGARYYDLDKDEFTVADVVDYTQQDVDEFYPGSGEPVNQSSRTNARLPSPEGYEKSYQKPEEFQDVIMGKEKNPEKIILTKNEDNSESVHLLNIKQAVKSLTKDTPAAFRKQLIQDLLNGL